VEQNNADLALRLSAGLYRYVLYEFHDEVVSWGVTALELPGAESHPQFSAVCGAVGEGLTLRGELRRARALAERALAGFADPDDRLRIPVLKVLTSVALYEGRLDDCVAQAGEQLRLARRYDDAWCVAEALLFRGLARTYVGDAAGGLAIADENLDVAAAVGNPSLTAWARYNQAEALALSDPETARHRYEQAITLAESVNSTFAANIADVGLAALLARSGDTDNALRAFRRTVHRWHRMQVWHHQWTTLRNLVRLLVGVRAYVEAATLLGAVGAADTAAYGTDADGLREAADLLGQALGAPAFTAAAARGSAMNADAKVDFALATIDRVLR
jgi:ATP/maltotriose-dependent transcriptional regulator MalT